MRLRNENVAQGVTIHWHGVDVPGREDGVAGVTQDAVLPGGQYVYRFVVPDAGTYWYHTHQDSVRSVARGLLGALVVLPATAPPADEPVAGRCHRPRAHLRTGHHDQRCGGLDRRRRARRRVGARAHDQHRQRTPARVGVRAPSGWSPSTAPTSTAGVELSDTFVELPAGGRADLLVPVTAAGTRVGVLGGAVARPRAAGADPPPLTARAPVRPLAYGTPGDAQRARAALGPVTVRFDYRVGRRLGFLDGRFGDWYTINGRTIPDVPMFMVRRG